MEEEGQGSGSVDPSDSQEKGIEVRINAMDPHTRERLERTVSLSSSILGMPIAFLAFFQKKAKRVRAVFGHDPVEAERYAAFVERATAADTTLVFHDVHEEPELQWSPPVQGPPYIRSFLGIPLNGPDGQPIGSICLFDTDPKAFQKRDPLVLQMAAEHVLHLLEAARRERS